MNLPLPWRSIILFSALLLTGVGAGMNLSAGTSTPNIVDSTEQTRVVSQLELKLVRIPAGSFTMGSPKNELGHAEEEGPQTRVMISRSFWLDQCEVTHGQWKSLMGTDLTEQVHRMLADDTLYEMGGMRRTERDYFHKKKDSDPNELLNNTDDNVPMHWVSWNEASSFCRKLTELERAANRLPDGYEYRLPTEAEWEYACRAGTTEETYAGKIDYKGKYNIPTLDTIAWYSGNSSVDYVGRGIDTTNWPQKQYLGGKAGPRAVGTKTPNPWELCDMLGNVNEWCNDWYAGALPGGSVSDPTGGKTGNYRIFRGGAWIYPAGNCRAAARRWDEPGLRREHIGFRIALAPVLR
ncbi:MAG TPA: formylglycine-generating enzyme family protein [Opitutaceae bacterium]|nr:formylglycine-generating enzyme family protein [Opitutaceae bacterium]